LRNIETLARQKGTETKRAAVMSLCDVGHACVAFWRKYDINTRVASHTFARKLFSMTELVAAADHHHEPVAVHRLRRCPGRGEFGECRQSES
jgi:hypothetical protein